MKIIGILIFLFGSIFAETKTMTIQGELDPRLELYFTVRFESITETKECMKKGSRPGQLLPLMGFKGVKVISEKYQEVLPLVYKDNNCEWKFKFVTAIIKRRNEKRNRYATYSLLSYNSTSIHSMEVDGGSYSSSVNIFPLKYSKKKYYYLGDNIQFNCQSDGSGKFVSFRCLPNDYETKREGLDEINNMTVKLNVVVDESEVPFASYKVPKVTASKFQQWDNYFK